MDHHPCHLLDVLAGIKTAWKPGSCVQKVSLEAQSDTLNCMNMRYGTSKRRHNPQPSSEASGACPVEIVLCNTEKLWKGP